MTSIQDVLENATTSQKTFDELGRTLVAGMNRKWPKKDAIFDYHLAGSDKHLKVRVIVREKVTAAIEFERKAKYINGQNLYGAERHRTLVLTLRLVPQIKKARGYPSDCQVDEATKFLQEWIMLAEQILSERKLLGGI